jgi:hypothetical protein
MMLMPALDAPEDVVAAAALRLTARLQALSELVPID